MFSRKYLAFSLAEVLVTMAIIGIVAAMTIPSLIEVNQQIEAESAARSAYSTISNAINGILAENQMSELNGICNNSDNICFKNYMLDKLEYIKDCGSNISGCWTTYHYYDGTTASVSGAAIQLNNGMYVLFEWLDKSCNASNNDRCGRISVDANGPKGPNKFGKDTYVFHVWQNSVRPYGINEDTGNNQSCNKSDRGKFSGFGCTAKYVTKAR